MAMHSPVSSNWRAVHPRGDSPGAGEGRAERLASWLIVYLAALMTSLALVGSVWALGVAR